MKPPYDSVQTMRSTFRLLCFLLLITSCAAAQTAIRIDPASGSLGWLTHPYKPRYVPPINLSNSSRLEVLIRAGNLYLSARDVVALAIENNIDVEVQRYGPLLAREVLKRAQAGGALRSVGAPVAAGPVSVSLQGVNVNFSGGASAGAGTGVSSGGGIVTQLGPNIPLLDPTIIAFANFQHVTSPLSNTFLTGTTSLVQDIRTYQAQYAQNWIFGLSTQVSYSSQYTKVNSQQFTLNPYTAGNLDLQINQNLLNGFGSAVNGRNIRVQKNNLKVTDLQFKLQLITTVSAVLNLYWDLVSFVEDVRAREQAVQTAQQLFEGNKEQVRIGSLAEIEVTRAESQLYATKQDLIIAQTNLAQQETVLKNALSRLGVATSDLAGVHIVPLDKIVVPAQDAIRPVDDLVADAVSKRVEIEQGRINLESNHMNEQRADGRSHATGSSAAGCRVSGGRIRQPAGPDRAAQFSQLFGGFLAEYFSAQSCPTVGLCDQSPRDPAERIKSAEEHQSSPRRRAECSDRPGAGALAIRRRGAGADSGAANPGSGPEAIQPGSGDSLSGGTGSARPGERPEF
jgi:outer membrane protein